MELELSHIIDALPGVVWTALPDGRVEYLNRRWCDYTGFRQDQAIGSGWQCAIHAEDRPRVLERWRSLLDSGKPGELEARLRRYDGEYRRFLVSAAPITDQSGLVVRWCGIHTDIEERLKAEERVQASEAELQRAYAQLTVAQRVSAMGSFTADLVADEHTWSEESYRIFELDRATPPKMQLVRDLVHPEDLPHYDAVIERCIAGHDVDFVFRIVTPRGVVKHLRAATRLIEHIEGRPVFMGAVQDVTDTKLAEAALRAREAEVQRALDHLTEAQRLGKTGSFTSDLLHDEHFWSDGFYRICEFEPGAKVTIQKLQEIVLPEDLALFQGAIQRALSGIDPEFVFRILTPRGVVKHLRGIAHRIQHIADRPVFVGAVQDVTESKLAEDALNRTRAELTHVARVMALGALTASIAHEVNQSVGVVRNNARAALRFLDREPPDLAEVREALECVVNETYRAGDIIRRIRDQVKRMPPREESIDLNNAIEEVIAIVRTELSMQRVSVQIQLAEGLPPVLGDRVQLQQVMLNLILNAIEAMISIDDEVRELIISTESSSVDGPLVAISDSGPGVAADDRERIFESFYTTKPSGIGIGLSICRSIIAGHGGRLWADARQPRGAVFRFTLPSTHD